MHQLNFSFDWRFVLHLGCEDRREDGNKHWWSRHQSVYRWVSCGFDSQAHDTIYGIWCHMQNSATYPILRHMVGYTNDQQLHK